jgi:hypothetical protein
MAPANANVYAAPDQVPIGDYVAAVGRSTVPNYRYDEASEFVRDDGFMDHPAGEWAPELEGGSTGIPDAHRNNVMALYDFRPTVTKPPEEWWAGPHGPGTENLERHRAVETVDGDGWREFRGDMTRKRAIPDIRRTPPAESRKTSDMAPVTYSYTRPWDQDVSRHLNGQHFSMADHYREYPIYGMQPVSNRRNTFRADPMPWDTNIVDMPPTYSVAMARITPIEVPRERSWRAPNG